MLTVAHIVKPPTNEIRIMADLFIEKDLRRQDDKVAGLTKKFEAKLKTKNIR